MHPVCIPLEATIEWVSSILVPPSGNALTQHSQPGGLPCDNSGDWRTALAFQTLGSVARKIGWDEIFKVHRLVWAKNIDSNYFFLDRPDFFFVLQNKEWQTETGGMELVQYELNNGVKQVWLWKAKPYWAFKHSYWACAHPYWACAHPSLFALLQQGCVKHETEVV